MVSIFRFPRCLTAKSNLHPSLKIRLGVKIGVTAVLLSILASLIIGHTLSEQQMLALNIILALFFAILNWQIATEETRLALEKERETSELKSRFIAIAAHEFRTPLTIILLACDLLRNNSHKLTEEKKQKLFHQIQSSVKHLNLVVEDVLHISKTQAGKQSFNPIPLHLTNFCQEIVEQLQLCAGEKYQLKFVSQSTPHQPLIDEKLLRQILTNLLTNAIKYSPQGGPIQIELTCDRHHIIFCIQDQGIGIPQEEQTKIFTSFFRCSNTGKLHGTGLGLTIVKNAVEIHGGQITLQSQEGVGTKFTVILPYSTTTHPSKSQSTNPPAADAHAKNPHTHAKTQQPYQTPQTPPPTPTHPAQSQQ